MNIKNTSKKKHNKKYETPEKIGEKWQIDAKYLPNECKVKLPEDKRYYQYTCIDEKCIKFILYIFVSAGAIAPIEIQ